VTGTTYTIDARYSGSTISVYLNGSPVAGMSITDSALSGNTKSGLYSSNNSPGPTWDNFKITGYQ
jgi:hypothetical protein